MPEKEIVHDERKSAVEPNGLTIESKEIGQTYLEGQGERNYGRVAKEINLSWLSSNQWNEVTNSGKSETKETKQWAKVLGLAHQSAPQQLYQR